MLRVPVGHATQSRGLPRGGWLALVLSVAIHGLLLVALSCVPSGTLHADRSPPVVTAVAIADDPGGAPGREPDPPRVEPESPATIQVVPIAEVTPPPAPEAVPTLPSVAGADPVGTDRGTEGPTGSGGPGSGSEAVGPVFFQVAAHGDSVVYVLDCSTSMGLNGIFADARREVLASLDRLPQSSHFQVICYNSDAAPLNIGGRTDLVAAELEHKRAAAVALLGIRPARGTNHLEALRQALALEPDVIFWVTDGADLTGEQVRAVTTRNRGRTAIHTIELTTRDSAGPETPLSWLARYNRGTYTVVAPAGGE